MPRCRPAVALVPLVLLALACGDDDDPPSGAAGTGGTPPATAAATTAPASPAPGASLDVVAGEPFPAARCEANRAAGTITYLSGFDFAATASIVEVLVAEERGWFDELCLDVEVRSSFSTANYPIVAANEAQFASAGSFSETVDFSLRNDAELVTVAVEGKTGIDALILRGEASTDPADLAGATIGVKGALTRGVEAMLQQAGLIEGEDYTTVLIDGFDPKIHVEIPDIDGFPGYKSNEPLQLEAAGIPFTLLDPADHGIPGSFGVLYSNADFVAEHPTAVEDFLRASMRGLAEAIADPVAASDVALGFINAGGNAMFLSPDGERARWAVESELVASTNTATAVGVPEPDALVEEVTAYAAVGLFDGTPPDITAFVAVDPISRVYAADRTVVWPG
jgi:ABC-type nitrate/sulfonate/bicarbonate transport system substrate-binding protein